MSINLVKGQKIDLTKDNKSLKSVFMGLGWDPAKKKEGGILSKIFGGNSSSFNNVDLDASVVLFGKDKTTPIETIYFGNLRTIGVTHYGDNLTGDGDGDDEVIEIRLSELKPEVEQLIFIINSYRGQTFNEIDNCFCRLVNKDNNEELAMFKLKEHGNFSAMIMAKLYKHNGEWKMAAIGKPADGKTVKEIMPSIISIL